MAIKLKSGTPKQIAEEIKEQLALESMKVKEGDKNAFEDAYGKNKSITFDFNFEYKTKDIYFEGQQLFGELHSLLKKEAELLGIPDVELSLNSKPDKRGHSIPCGLTITVTPQELKKVQSLTEAELGQPEPEKGILKKKSSAASIQKNWQAIQQRNVEDLTDSVVPHEDPEKTQQRLENISEFRKEKISKLRDKKDEKQESGSYKDTSKLRFDFTESQQRKVSHKEQKEEKRKQEKEKLAKEEQKPAKKESFEHRKTTGKRR